MDFTHPAARGAKVWTAKLKTGETKKILLIVTNAELNEDKKKYKPDIVSQLVSSAEEFMEEHGDIDGYVLANRMRDWENSRDR